MKAALYYGPDDVRYENVPKPKIGSSEILLEMKACGLCGSDIMEWYLKERTPLVLGHEPTGVVAEVGDKVKAFKPGDRVFVHHHVACLSCHFCTHGDFTMCGQFRRTNIDPGGFAEYIRVPSPNVQIDTLKIPDDLTFEEAALIEPVACAIRGIMKCNIRPGDAVAIIGDGPSGIYHVELARLLGAGKVIVSGHHEYRLRAAKKFGADLAINPREESLVERVKEATGGRGADVVVDTAPRIQAISDGIDICRKGGVVYIFAPVSPDKLLVVSPHRLFFSEVSLVSSYSTSHVETRMALSLISSGRIKAKELITHRFKLNQVGDAIKLASKSKECLKIMILNE